MSGYFITFEGGDGVGKSAQVHNLYEHLKGRGYEVVMTREPGGTRGAEAIRHILLSGQAQQYGPLIEAVLFTAARIDHVTEVIAPALQEGKVILCDRFVDSTRAYQGLNDKVSSSTLSILERVALNGIMPNLTFLLDISAEYAMERANTRRSLESVNYISKKAETIDYFEKDNLEIQEQRRKAFLRLAEQEPHRFRVIDATDTMRVVADQIKSICDQAMMDHFI
ncbi:dTMP kinase [Bartonella vinsonii]|uniref:Thymidylate kinase n=1 Tax=Bartonella vinsonii TaxID=33047 RepID=A0A448V6E5_BARVI|nr:dTMP kinase [Bartonella vinsonii]VEJ45347.1 Thymidylate kinase [Bartonella vinsonii]